MSRLPDTNSLTFWQHLYRQSMQHYEALMKLHDKRKPGPVRDALWNGAYAIRKQAEHALSNALALPANCLTMFVEGKA